ncbi:MAG: efflux RND transporter periplasmic adaptor subunit, partial [Betaproteobacteria bacterium]|nr:efflux RND transporter periplasmic adaptor subunit [Betaproteobacteria bacterium]
APGDVMPLAQKPLMVGVPFTGSIKAIQSAVIKARVAGELMDLVVREGDPVRAGQVLARIEPTEYLRRLQQFKDQADAAKAQIDIAQRQFDNNQALVDQGFISKTALETSLATLQGAQASHKAALSAAEVAAKSLEDAVLRSPIQGQVSARLAQPGERLAIDAKVLELVDLGRLEIEVPMSAADVLSLRVGQIARVQVEGQELPGQAKVVRISPSTQSVSRSVMVYLSVPTAPGLRHGQFVQGMINTDQAQVLAVPLSAVRTERAQAYVQTVVNGKVVYRSVGLGLRGHSEGSNDTWVGISGVEADSTIITGAVGSLREGLSVKVNPPVKAP